MKKYQIWCSSSMNELLVSEMECNAIAEMIRSTLIGTDDICNIRTHLENKQYNYIIVDLVTFGILK